MHSKYRKENDICKKKERWVYVYNNSYYLVCSHKLHGYISEVNFNSASEAILINQV